MKQEWKPDEMRASAEEIRAAIMPKSVTPEMVGGTLLGLVNAVGEVVEVLGEIPREHVKVVVNGYDGSNRVSGAGATVWLDVFTTKGFPAVSLPRQELTADENGVVEFDIPHGFKYAVFSQINGLSASFQIVGNAAGDYQKIELWNFPVGIYALGYCDICNDGEAEDGSDYYTREVPFVTSAVSDDSAEYQEDAEWDVDQENGEYSDGYGYIGILVSTADTSFVITPNSKSEKSMVWCQSRDYGTLIPGMPAISFYDENGVYQDDLWEEAVARARADMDGNMNTAKILDFCSEPTAALFAAASDYFYTEQRFLPSAGQLYIMWLNRDAINALMNEFSNMGVMDGFSLLPTLKPGTTSSWTSYESWWSSTICTSFSSWVVRYDGLIYTSNRSRTLCVRAVSAFHFEY